MKWTHQQSWQKSDVTVMLFILGHTHLGLNGLLPEVNLNPTSELLQVSVNSVAVCEIILWTDLVECCMNG